jgi:hypothetical protein
MWLVLTSMALGMTVTDADQTRNVLPSLRYLEDPQGQLQQHDVLLPYNIMLS